MSKTRGYIATLLNRLSGDIRQPIQAAFDALVDTTESPRPMGFVLGDGSTTPSTGIKGVPWRAPAAGQFTRVTLIGDTNGAAVVDLLKTTYDGFPPSAANSICGGRPVVLQSGRKTQDETLRGWTVSFDRGDLFCPRLVSVSSLTALVVEAEWEPS